MIKTQKDQVAKLQDALKAEASKREQVERSLEQETAKRIGLEVQVVDLRQQLRRAEARISAPLMPVRPASWRGLVGNNDMVRDAQAVPGSARLLYLQAMRESERRDTYKVNQTVQHSISPNINHHSFIHPSNQSI